MSYTNKIDASGNKQCKRGHSYEPSRRQCPDCVKTKTPGYKQAYRSRLKSNGKLSDHDRNYALKARFGIGLSDFRRMAESQNGKCGICEEVAALNVDHCHVSGKIRGLLCNNCNNGIGRFKDKPNVLERAAEYVRKHGA